MTLLRQRLLAGASALSLGLGVVGAATVPAQAASKTATHVVVLARPHAVVASATSVAQVSVAGRVTPVLSGRVALERRAGKAWVVVARSDLGRKGTWAMTARGLKVGRVTLRVVSAAAAHRPSVASATFVVTVLPPRHTVTLPTPVVPTAPVPPAPPSAPAPGPSVPGPTGPAVPPHGAPIECSGLLPTRSDPSQLAISLVADPLGYVGKSFGTAVFVTGGVAPYYLMPDGPVPAGLSVPRFGAPAAHVTDLYIVGVPVSAGVTHVRVSVTDSLGATASADLCLQFADPLKVATASLPDATVGQPYSARVTVTGGFQPVALGTRGPPQAAENLYSEAGSLLGNPDVPGLFSVPLTVTDGAGSQIVAWRTLTVGPLPTARTLHVPGDASSIQAAIELAGTGDTVLVAPGTYRENLDFLGKAITVRSSAGPARTVVDGGQHGSVVRFAHQEPPQAVLQGFALVHGTGDQVTLPYLGSGPMGGGIIVQGASPTIVGNVVTDDVSGVGIDDGAPLLQGNVIKNTGRSDADAADGVGVYVTGATEARFVGNTVKANGYGFEIGPSQNLSLQGNLVTGNVHGGLISGSFVELDSVDDAFLDNGTPSTTGPASGLAVESGLGGSATLLNDTITSAATPLQTWVGATVRNSVIEGSSHLTSMALCDDASRPPAYDHDVLWTTSAVDRGLGADCAREGTDSVVADPHFVDAAHGSLTPAAGSPLVDAGVADPSLPSTDQAGHPRLVNGAVDIGAYERQ